MVLNSNNRRYKTTILKLFSRTSLRNTPVAQVLKLHFDYTISRQIGQSLNVFSRQHLVVKNPTKYMNLADNQDSPVLLIIMHEMHRTQPYGHISIFSI